MSCFIGLSVQPPIPDQTYQSALSQIHDYISQTSQKIPQNPSLLTITNNYQKFHLPKNSQYLYTNLQHLVVSQEEDEEFVEDVVECLMILKEYLPHKVEIEMVSDLEQVFNMRAKVQQEVPRRLISHLKILYDRAKKVPLTDEEVHMLVSNVAADFHKDYKQKIKTLSLRILSQAKIDPKTWNSLTKQQIKTIDEIVNEPIYQKPALQILQKIVRSNDHSPPSPNPKQNIDPNSNSNSNSNSNPQSNPYSQSQSKNTSFIETLAIPEYEGPFDPMTALFQLKQSNCISRISWIIQQIQCDKLGQKKLAKFDHRIKEVMEKFLRDFYPDVPCSHLNFFGHSLAEYEMRRSNLNWDGLVEQVLQKIQQKQKQLQKQQPKSKGRLKPPTHPQTQK